MYEWVKVVHILAIISWMAGMLYLPRLMVYHVEAELGSKQDETFKVMERRLLKAIMTPAMVVSLLSGLYLAWLTAGHNQPWFLIKFAAVLGMFAVHGILVGHVRRLAKGERTKSGTYFRVLNEVPTVLMVIIVIMVVIKPFS